MSVNNRVLVAGAQGVSGRAASEHWREGPATHVVGLSRRAVPSETGGEQISVDLLDVADTRQKLSSIKNVTHIVFGAYVERATPSEKTEDNVAILKNLLDIVVETSPNLRHVTFYQGGKAYGADLGKRCRSAAESLFAGYPALRRSSGVFRVFGV